MNKTFEQLIAEVLKQAHEGWDFSYIADRRHSENPSWAYGDTVLTKLAQVETMLDTGTGGGEFLLSLRQRASVWPKTVIATEGYPPNVLVAKRTLAPVGIEVIDHDSEKPLPFAEETSDLVINRHDFFKPLEVLRVLKPGGKFITQQVGSEMNRGLNELLDAPVKDYKEWVLERAVEQLAGVGFAILDKKEHRGTCRFDDVGAIVWYLNAIPWQIPDFSVERYEERLRQVHEEIGMNGPIEVKNHFFYIEAQKSTTDSGESRIVNGER
ncbi:MAG: class I SAM-dependent methyltransferase [Chloroflexota bacterium]